MSSIDTSTSQYGFPTGHLGRLTPEQEDALQKFKSLLQTEGLFCAARDGQPQTHNDALLLRFLRARRFVPNDALKQFAETAKWRKENNLDDLYMNIDVDEYDLTRRYYTHSIGRRDRRGLPVYLFRIGALDSKAMSAYSKSGKGSKTSKLLPLFATFENLAGWSTQLATILNDRPNPDVPITQASNIVDISNVGLMQFWSLRSHMQDATVLSTSHYPEMLDRIFIVGAPSFFPTVWSWIKGIFDPITASKIFILSDADAFSTLSQFIEPENVPKKYGGGLDFDFGDVPTIEPAYAGRLTWSDGASGTLDAEGALRRWPRGPTRWLVRDDGNWDLQAVGSHKGQARRETLATLRVGANPGGSADAFVVSPNQRA